MWTHKSETVARAPTQKVNVVAAQPILLEGSMNRIGFMIDRECSMSLSIVPVNIIWILMLTLKNKLKYFSTYEFDEGTNQPAPRRLHVPKLAHHGWA
jgi:hypothetical protein